MKNMLATLCSKPAATNAEIGKTIAATLSITDRLAAASQTARQTKAFARMPDQYHEERQRGLGGGCGECRHADPEVVSSPPFGEVDHRHHRECADRIPQIDDAPVREQPSDTDVAGNGAHHDQVVPGEQLRSRHDHQDEAEREPDTGEPTCRSNPNSNPSRS